MTAATPIAPWTPSTPVAQPPATPAPPAYTPPAPADLRHQSERMA
jgi:hypothetical protein